MIARRHFLLLPFAAYAAPVQEDLGTAGLVQALRRLQSTARVLYVTTHPDDEDAATITYLSRGLGAQVTLLSLTRGESGKNLVSSHKLAELGALRSLELAKAAEHYACDVRFTTFADFGPAKSLEEVWRHWDRRRLTEEVVAAIRQVKPHVVLGRWQGTAEDGDAQHQATGVVVQAAFDAVAGDTDKPLKLYVAARDERAQWMVRIDSGVYDPVLGESYAQIGGRGYAWHRSQGAPQQAVSPGPALAFYLLARYPVPQVPPKEMSIFDGLERIITPPTEMRSLADQAMRQLSITSPENLASVLAQGLRVARALNSPRVAELWQRALALAIGADLEVGASRALIAPGDEAALSVNLHLRTGLINRTIGPPIRTPGLGDVEGGFVGGVRPAGAANQPRVGVDVPDGWKIQPRRNQLTVTASADAATTSAFAQADDARLSSRALPDLPVKATATYDIEGVQIAMEKRIAVALGPPVSLRFRNEVESVSGATRQFQAVLLVSSIGNTVGSGQVRLEVPAGWTASPAVLNVKLDSGRPEQALTFTVTAPATGNGPLGAVAVVNGREYRNSFVAVTASGLDTVYVERPAKLLIRRIGY